MKKYMANHPPFLVNYIASSCSMTVVDDLLTDHSAVLKTLKKKTCKEPKTAFASRQTLSGWISSFRLATGSS